MVYGHQSSVFGGGLCCTWPRNPWRSLTAVRAVQQIIADNSLRLGGIVGIYPAASVGDDIHVYSSEERTDHVATFHGLRQQAEKDTPEAYMSLSDFIAPREAGVPDYLGLFANACFGLDKLVQPFKDAVQLLLHVHPCRSPPSGRVVLPCAMTALHGAMLCNIGRLLAMCMATAKLLCCLGAVFTHHCIRQAAAPTSLPRLMHEAL